MINTVLFDLDGTLLQINQEEFTTAYFTEIKKVFVRLKLNPELALKALWGGTKAMVSNDGTKSNSERFWEYFTNAMDLYGERLKIAEDTFERFYCNEFDNIKSILKENNPELPRRLVRSLTSRGFDVVLATNPLFPKSAITTRLNWLELTPLDFCLITDYSNSTYCKPNNGYYCEIFNKINKEPHQCLMVGNNTAEDMCVGDLGAETFLVTDYLENEDRMDISVFRHGTLAELEKVLDLLPRINEKSKMSII